MSLPPRKAACHPTRKHHSKGLCVRCYQDMRNVNQSSSRGSHGGIVRVPIRGWGFVG